MLTYSGTLKSKSKTQKVSEKFSKRDFTITDNAQSYPQVIQFQLTQDRCTLIDRVQEGEEVTVHFLLKGREWKNPQGEVKVFNTLDVFRVESKIGITTNARTIVPENDDDISDLPF